MCLHVIKPIPERLKKGEHTGYKVMKMHGMRYHGLWYSNYKRGDFGYVSGGQYKARKEGLLRSALDGFTYKSGFHIYASIKAARAYADSKNLHIVKVRYSDVVAYGEEKKYQRAKTIKLSYRYVHHKVVVAKNMKIIGEVK